MDVLAKLFGSPARVKIMRLFLLNGDSIFTTQDIKTKSKVTTAMLRRELVRLKSVGFIKQKSFFQEGKPFKNGKIPKKNS